MSWGMAAVRNDIMVDVCNTANVFEQNSQDTLVMDLDTNPDKYLLLLHHPFPSTEIIWAGMVYFSLLNFSQNEQNPPPSPPRWWNETSE